MADRAELVRTLHQDLPETVGDDRAGQRRIGGGQAFGDGDEIRFHAVMVGAEHRAEAAETGHHLVSDQQDVVFLKHGLDLVPITPGRRYDAAGAEDGLADEGRDRFRTFREDHFLQLVGTKLRELFLAHRAVRAAEIIRRFGMQDRHARQVEGLVEEFEAGQTSGHDAGSVIAAPARDDLLLFRPPEDVVVIPDQLNVGLVGIGAGKTEIDLDMPSGARSMIIFESVIDASVPCPT